MDLGFTELLIIAEKEAAEAQVSMCRNADSHMETDHTGLCQHIV